VRSAARLLRTQGYEATGMKEIARHSGATLGSIYHFFPGGKQELGAEAIRHSDSEFAAALAATLERHPDPGQAIIACTRLLAAELAESGWVCGCPVSAAALESVGRTPGIEGAAARAFEQWRELVYRKLRHGGLSERNARELAVTVLNTTNGALLACQLARSQTPLLTAGKHLARLVSSYQPKEKP